MFIALTALEEFWDRTEPILFAGEWSKLFSKKDTWEKLNFKDAPFVWDNVETTASRMAYCDKLYDRTLLKLTEVLNVYHGKQGSTNFYRIIAGSWLIHFIQQLYDKYLTLKIILRENPDAITWLLNKNQFYTPLDFFDYLHKISGDEYSLQLYSQLLSGMGYDFPIKELFFPLKENSLYKITPSLKHRCVHLFQATCGFISKSVHRETITITAPYFSSGRIRNMIELMWRSRFKIIFDDMDHPIEVFCPIDQNFRKTIINLGDNEFECLLGKILVSNIPRLFVEGHDSFMATVNKLPIYPSKVFFTANALQGNNIYKLYLAKNYKKVKILCGQHGGGYGIDYMHTPEKYEISVSDVFYTSGWQKGEGTRPLSVQKFKPIDVKNKRKHKILLAINEVPRYLYRIQFQNMSSGYLNCIQSIIAFITGLEKKSALLIRTYPPEKKGYGWDTDRRIKEYFPDLVYDDFRRKFKDRLISAKLYVTSGLHTTYMEAIAQNTPSLCFIDRNVYKFHPNSQPCFEALEKAGILHYSPESAYRHVNKYYGSIDTWWSREDVQAARELFVQQYVHCREDWINEWVSEFNRQLHS